MSAWNEVMQGLHSALIDELSERYPAEKLELGLPKRFGGWSLLPDATQAVHLQIELEGSVGVCLIAGGKAQSLDELESIVLATSKRAESEFQRRRVSPQFLKPISASRPERPEAIPDPALLITFPIRIRSDAEGELIFDLALGV